MEKHRHKVTAVKFFEEFKKFILRGNVVDLAVGVIIGGAFNKIVTSLVNDIVMPLLSVIIGQNSFEKRFIALDGNTYASIDAAGSAPILRYGSFIATVLDFLLMGLVIFLLVKGINFFSEKLNKEKEKNQPEVKPVKNCPHCLSEINAGASVCAFCGRDVAGE